MSAATVIATIDSAKIAQQLIDELLEAGFKDQDVEILAGDEDELVAEIVERGFGKDDARDYAEAVNRGKSLVAARAPEDKAERAAAIMERYETSTGESSPQEQGETVQEIEEELSVGKRKVAERRGAGHHQRQRAAGRGDRHLARGSRSRSSAGRRTAS